MVDRAMLGPLDNGLLVPNAAPCVVVCMNWSIKGCVRIVVYVPTERSVTGGYKCH